ncbi:MAG: MASE1 domain-containing protein, partial [Pseudolabrys sp.]
MAAAIDQPSARYPRGLLRDIWPPVAVTIAYYSSAEVTLLVDLADATSNRIFTPFWLSSAILFVALTLAPTSHWWRYLVATLPIHFVVAHFAQFSMVGAAVALAANVCVAVLNAVAVRRWCNPRSYFGNLRSAIAYVAAVVIAGPMLASLIGAWAPILNSEPLSSYGHIWFRWWVSNALGTAILGSLLLMLLEQGDDLQRSDLVSRLWGVALIPVLIIGASLFAFPMNGRLLLIGYTSVLLYLPVPLVLWA